MQKMVLDEIILIISALWKVEEKNAKFRANNFSFLPPPSLHPQEGN